MGETTEARKTRKRLGQQIAERRKALGSQDQLAERLEVDAETVSRFERGATVPSLFALDTIASVLNTHIADLLSEASARRKSEAQ